jgi:hypothetical protein
MRKFGNSTLNLGVAVASMLPLELLAMPFILIWRRVSNLVRLTRS